MTETKRIKFTQRLADLLAGAEQTQAWLAEESDLAPSAVSRLLSGDRVPQPEHAIALARALKCSIADVLGGTDHEDLLRKWVSIEQLTQVQQEFSATRRDLASLQTKLDGATARGLALEASLATRIEEAARLRGELAATRALQERLDAAAKGNEKATQEISRLSARLDQLVAHGAEKDAQALSLAVHHDQALARTDELVRERNDWRRYAEQLDRDNRELRVQRNAVGAVAGLSLLAMLAKE